MATVSMWSPFDVALDLTATAGTVTRTSATEFTVSITAKWECHYDGAETTYAMDAISGGVTKNISAYNSSGNTKGSATFTGKYAISGNGSATKSITVTFKNYDYDGSPSATKAITLSVSVPAWTSYTVSYNANGGSGAPSSQTKWKNQTLTLSSTKPTRSGYTFMGWGTSTTDTTVDYSAGGSYTANASDTLYAIWKKTITLTYNANNGSNAPSSQSATIYNATTSYKFTLSSTKPTRTGYTFLGWSTSNTATSASYSAGGTITLSANDTLYAVWKENTLTVNFYSNYATESFDDALNTVDSTKNVIVRTATYYYDNDCSNGLWDYSYEGASTYLARKGYEATGYWGTSTEGGTLVSESTSFSTSQQLAEAFGQSLESGNATVNLYPQWKRCMLLHINQNGNWLSGLAWIKYDGTWKKGIPWINVNGTWKKEGA